MSRLHTTLLALSLVASIPMAALAQEVRDREANQQGRIGQGVASGQVTAKGAAHLENREANINASRRADRAANGGHLTARETRNLNRRENAVSGQIYRDKHNDVAQPGVTPRG